MCGRSCVKARFAHAKKSRPEITPPARSPLLPDRHPIQDFFICDVTDAIPKDDMGSMEHPIFSLATKPDLSVREYEHKGIKVTIAPSVLGLATIHDKDILIYCISQLVAQDELWRIAQQDPASESLRSAGIDQPQYGCGSSTKARYAGYSSMSPALLVYGKERRRDD